MSLQYSVASARPAHHTPQFFPELMAAAWRKDLYTWAARQELQVDRAE